ncbi:TIGR02679 family protein [Amycolatopsis anabasis]|uniref:TIGR02679 family protein n=1 Tax=Amycolatopsis anabasis TaxID=1840409 RepID=UPI00131AD6AF|nr:TIGR02679 family protein [Amycolatopsis anabasis]
MGIDHDRLARLLGDRELAWLVDRVRRRLERGEPLDTSVTLTGSTPDQRAAVHRLLGRRPRPGATLSVSLAAVDQVLRGSGACPDGLAAAVVALTGPVTERAAAFAAAEQAWQHAFAPLDAVVTELPALADWRAHLHTTGLVRRLAGTPDAASSLLADLAAVIRKLPASGEPLGTFAARVAGSAHALDDNRPLTTLTIGAARALSGLPEGSGAEWRREVWAAVGLLRDEVSSTVLTLGLPGDSSTPTGRALAALRTTGEPVVLTLRQLVRDTPTLSLADQVVSVCENPVVISSAADRLGPACAPLVCTHGQPGAATLRLLRLLTDAGARLRYHGDFDWGGLRIGNFLFERLPLTPWRFDTAAYHAVSELGRPLTGTPVTATWDPDLTPAMTASNLALEEELVLDQLLEDLATDAAGRASVGPT